MSEIRNFSIVVFDDTDNITDRFNLDLVTTLSGLGYTITLSTIATDIEDYVTKIVQTKTNLKMKVWHKSYQTYNSFMLFIQKYLTSSMALEYNDTTRDFYWMGKIISSDKGGEKNEYGYLENTITFQPLTPLFSVVKNQVKIQYSAQGKSYPYSYSYCYGTVEVLNNKIINSYIKEIPLIIIIYGPMLNNPQITLTDSEGNVYTTIHFLDVSLKAGERIIINSATKKIWFDDGTGVLQDYYYKLDPLYDSFLRAKAEDTSIISINLLSGDDGYLEGMRRQYKL